MASVAGNVTHLRLVQPVPLNVSRGCPLTALEQAGWLGTPTPAARPDTRRYLTDLSLPVRARVPALTFKKAAFVDLGVVRPTPDGCELEISWQSSSFAPLFPVFAGKLTLTATELRLEGFYAPPGGDLGAALDRAFLNIAARGTARWFLDQAVAAVAANTTVARAVAPTASPDRPDSTPAAQSRPISLSGQPGHGVGRLGP